MLPIKDQDLSKTQRLISNIVHHAVEQANFTIRLLNQRSTVHMLMQCEDTLTDLLPIIEMVSEEHAEFSPIYDQMKTALNAAQMGGEPLPIEQVEEAK
ncbi:hypothetical protein EXT48_08300 [Pseudoalteromonas sp. CO348]|uniref:hypothetical protein n=1 Tax=Pseudoalteromonas sp. CO348 TaxID=1777271 RepID=UPI001022DFF2|nr:hypothetical protein [Pseudoalteromonas sp. CO348]RZG05525.1 hypothetical protein EXT48_08300 [Pseudoalteromonas sp. CO348]